MTDDPDPRIGQCRAGWTLEQAFYTNPDVFAMDMERIFLRDWLFFGHVSRIPKRGDFMPRFMTEMAACWPHGICPKRSTAASSDCIRSLAEKPRDFDGFERDIGPFLAPHGFSTAKTAARLRYDVNANWKIVAENAWE